MVFYASHAYGWLFCNHSSHCYFMTIYSHTKSHSDHTVAEV